MERLEAICKAEELKCKPEPGGTRTCRDYLNTAGLGSLITVKKQNISW